MAKVTKPAAKAATRMPAKAVKKVTVKAPRPARIETSPFTFGELFGFTIPYMRQRYWGVKISVFVLNFVVSLLFGMLMAAHPLFILPIIVLPMLFWWVSYVTTLKRLRDANLSLYWALMSFIPLVNIVTVIVYGSVGSSETKNERSAAGVWIATAVLWAFFIIIPVLAVAAYMVYNQQHAAAAGEATPAAMEAPAPAPAPEYAPMPEPAPEPMAAPAN